MPTSSPLVLVADDEPSMLELVAKHLSMLDDPKLEVIQASDGEEAWRLAREHLPDLVVLDVMMPGMSGWEVCRKIREDVALAHTGVVMLTGIGENLNQMTSPLYGADAYVDKPFEFDDFDDRIRETLRARESQRLGVSRAPINGTSGAAKAAPERREPVEGRVVVKTAPKKAAAPAKKAAPKKATAKKAAPKKATAKKATAKKAAPKKKATAKKTTAKKAAPKKKATAKKAAPKKKATAKKTTAKKAAPKKKTTAKKAAPKKKATARRR